MIRRLFPASRKTIDSRGGHAVGGLRRQQQVVDADAVVLLPGPGLIVPECVDPGARMAGAYRIGQDKPVFVYRLIAGDTVEVFAPA